MRVALLTLALFACERADPADVPAPRPPRPPQPVPEAAAPRPVARTHERMDLDLVRAFGPPDPTPVEHGLPPSPITDRTVYDPQAYDAWVAELTPAQRRRVANICASAVIDFRPECDGIGPLHIPVPPMDLISDLMMAAPPAHTAFVSYAHWEFVLTAAQSRYVANHCSGKPTRASDLCGEAARNTPLVISFDAAPVAYTTGARFAFAPGEPVTTDWPTTATPWLALDRDGNGRIDSGEELFGDHTRLADGRRGRDGFEALAALDDNHDGRIDAADPAFASLVLWGDDLRPASTVIDSISLAVTREHRCDARGNCEGARADIRWHDERGEHAGAIVDVYLPIR